MCIYIYRTVCIYITVFFTPHLRTFFHCFFFKGGAREKEREKHRLAAFSYAPWLGIEPETYVCAQTGNGTCAFEVYRMMLPPTETHWPGLPHNFFIRSSVGAHLECFPSPHHFSAIDLVEKSDYLTCRMSHSFNLTNCSLMVLGFFLWSLGSLNFGS